MTPDILKLWSESAAKFNRDEYVDISRRALCHRILLLIQAFRVMDEALKEFVGDYGHAELCEIADLEDYQDTTGCTCSIKLAAEARAQAEKILKGEK